MAKPMVTDGDNPEAKRPIYINLAGDDDDGRDTGEPATVSASRRVVAKEETVEDVVEEDQEKGGCVGGNANHGENGGTDADVVYGDGSVPNHTDLGVSNNQESDCNRDKSSDTLTTPDIVMEKPLASSTPIANAGEAAEKNAGGNINERQDHFDILSDSERFFKKYNMVGRELRITLKPLDGYSNPITWFDDAISAVLNHIKGDNVEDCDYLGLAIESENDPAKNVCVSYRRADQLKPDAVSNVISKVTQSNEAFPTSAPLIVSVYHVRMPNGCDRYRCVSMATFMDFCQKKRSIITINNGTIIDSGTTLW